MCPEACDIAENPIIGTYLIIFPSFCFILQKVVEII